jgi:predicted secreted protein
MNIVNKHPWWTVLLLVANVALGGSAAAQDLKVTLLGTGSPAPRMDRFGRVS